MKILVYPGSFDPFTVGHEDIARRAAKLADRLYIVVVANVGKTPAFSLRKRQEMIERCLTDLPNVQVATHVGLLVEYVRDLGANAVVRGLRTESDYRFETEIHGVNRLLYDEYETIYLPCRTDLTFISSSYVREVAALGGDISRMVPSAIVDSVLRHTRQFLEES